jgi:hypothetical protein
MLPTEQTNENLPWQNFCIVSFWAWALATERLLHSRARKTAELGAMKNDRNPTTYLTAEELRQIAAAKFEEASGIPARLRKGGAS